MSTAPAIDAEDKEVAYGVSIIAIFGMIGMLVYPYLARVLFTSSEQIGMFLGTAIHDTSQVVGAAMAYKEIFHDERVLQAATVTKLTRNLFLAVIVPLLAYLHFQTAKRTTAAKVNIYKLFPVFVLGFIGMAILRSVGDVAWNSAAWKDLTNQIGDVWGSRYLLGIAMAAVGAGHQLFGF